MAKVLFTIFILAMGFYLWVILPQKLRSNKGAKTRMVMLLGVMLVIVLTILKCII